MRSFDETAVLMPQDSDGQQILAAVASYVAVVAAGQEILTKNIVSD